MVLACNHSIATDGGSRRMTAHGSGEQERFVVAEARQSGYLEIEHEPVFRRLGRRGRVVTRRCHPVHLVVQVDRATFLTAHDPK